MLLFDTFNEFFVKQNNITLHQLFNHSIDRLLMFSTVMFKTTNKLLVWRENRFRLNLSVTFGSFSEPPEPPGCPNPELLLLIPRFFCFYLNVKPSLVTLTVPYRYYSLPLDHITDSKTGFLKFLRRSEFPSRIWSKRLWQFGREFKTQEKCQPADFIIKHQ